ncbi:MAG: rhodanese-related sulfurtransferase [Gammaproteobacteria bacterium]
MTAVMTFYRFVELDRLDERRAELAAAADAGDLRGTVLLAAEGINGALAGERAALDAFHAQLTAIPELVDLPVRYSDAAPDRTVFRRLKVLIKDEIVALKQPGVRPGARTGQHVDWARWHALLDDPDVVVIDTRNRYEIGVGTFPGAVDPGTRSFRQWPDWVGEHLKPDVHRRVAMFCTGGIRCEKASAWLLDQGFAEVYQLDGGVLGYLESVPAAHNRWRGECYVFDGRVAVDSGLTTGTRVQCDACGMPLSTADQANTAYEAGIACPHCAPTQTPERRARFAERVRQADLTAARVQAASRAGGAAGDE